MMAAVNLTEALSAAATARANVQAAQAGLEIARTTLRQDVAANNAGAMLGAEIEPLQRPDTRSGRNRDRQMRVQADARRRPALAGLRESIRSALIQVKYAENQTLPQLNLGVQFGVTSEAGNSKCTVSGTVPAFANCVSPNGPVTMPPGRDNGALLPFGGDYGTALNGLFDFKFYDYAAVLGFSMPLDNAAAKAALAQAHISYEQSRLQYRQALYQAVLQVKSALANLTAYQEQVDATREATTLRAKESARYCRRNTASAWQPPIRSCSSKVIWLPRRVTRFRPMSVWRTRAWPCGMLKARCSGSSISTSRCKTRVSRHGIRAFEREPMTRSATAENRAGMSGHKIAAGLSQIAHDSHWLVDAGTGVIWHRVRRMGSATGAQSAGGTSAAAQPSSPTAGPGQHRDRADPDIGTIAAGRLFDTRSAIVQLLLFRSRCSLLTGWVK